MANPQPNKNKIPPFDALPLRAGDPYLSAWGLYGEDDELGALRRLDNEMVLDAVRGEVRCGYRYVCFVGTLCFFGERGRKRKREKERKSD
jgi:hypothetical protein